MRKLKIARAPAEKNNGMSVSVDNCAYDYVLCMYGVRLTAYHVHVQCDDVTFAQKSKTEIYIPNTKNTQRTNAHWTLAHHTIILHDKTKRYESYVHIHVIYYSHLRHAHTHKRARENSCVRARTCMCACVYVCACDNTVRVCERMTHVHAHLYKSVRTPVVVPACDILFY